PSPASCSLAASGSTVSSCGSTGRGGRGPLPPASAATPLRRQVEAAQEARFLFGIAGPAIDRVQVLLLLAGDEQEQLARVPALDAAHAQAAQVELERRREARRPAARRELVGIAQRDEQRAPVGDRIAQAEKELVAVPGGEPLEAQLEGGEARRAQALVGAQVADELRVGGAGGGEDERAALRRAARREQVVLARLADEPEEVRTDRRRTQEVDLQAARADREAPLPLDLRRVVAVEATGARQVAGERHGEAHALDGLDRRPVGWSGLLELALGGARQRSARTRQADQEDERSPPIH